ncbi:putative autophagy-related protein 11 isoform X1 [Parasteatoda tepidariorum]|uniref:putative autophagy-related protein 11 isoform X1 n=1 Tax=Parasteatoda tepidariorum TaxID=114398 RepID=UPI001C71F2EF|nr:uncharacterized protein LOC107447493 [Parasteatoda tepidariorum]
MEADKTKNDNNFISIAIACFLAIFFTHLLGKLYEKVVNFLRYMRILSQPQPSLTVNLHREVAELRRITNQISNDWGEMANVVTLFDGNNVKSDMKLMNESLHDSMLWFQDESDKTEQQYTEIKKTMSSILEKVDSLKETTRNNGDSILKTIQDCRALNAFTEHKYCQTEREIAVKSKIPEKKHSKDKIVESSSSKQTLRKILGELQREIRTNASKEREELMSQLEVISTQINNDREVIKNVLQQAFAATAYQNQQCFEKFGVAGQEVLNYMTEKSEKSNILMKDKFQEFDKKLCDIFESMKSNSVDVTSIRSTLDTIDSQLDDIFQRIELGCQKNADQCEEVLEGLETATEVWKNSTSRLSDMAQSLSDLNYGVEHLMGELKQRPGETSLAVGDISGPDSIFNTGDQNNSEHYYANLECFLKMQNLVQTCTEKISSLEGRIENDSSKLKMVMENLLRQIQFTCDLCVNVVEKFMQSEARQLGSTDYEAVNPEIGFKGDISTNAALREDAIQTATRIVDDPCMRSPKKNRPSKLKPPSSPSKRGKTIHSDPVSNNGCGKIQERNLESKWKK